MSHHEDKRDEPLDDEQFDGYLRRDSALSKQYKQGATDEVPAELDQKILSQARQVLNDKSNSKVVTHPSWWTKWNKPLALAATLLLAVTVIYRVGDRSIDRLASSESKALKQDAVASAESPLVGTANKVTQKSSAAAVPSPVQAEMKQASNEPASRTPSRTVPLPSQKESVPSPQVSFAAPAAGPAAPSPISQEAEKDKAAGSGALAKLPEKRTREVAPDIASTNDIGKLPDVNAESLQRVPGMSIQPSEERAATSKMEKPTDPEELLRHIRELRKQGKDKEAMQTWKQFRKDFPDYPVAADDLARVPDRNP